MPGWKEPTGADFYTPHIEEARRSAEVILPLLFERYGTPGSLIDVGCMCGAWCAEAARLGVVNVLGIDGPWIPRAALVKPCTPPYWCFLARDLERPLPEACSPLGIVLCLEVAEHLSHARQSAFVRELVNLHAQRVVFSAATPAQGYPNSRSEDDWVELFRNEGFAPQFWLRTAIANDSRCRIWYQLNIIVFEWMFECCGGSDEIPPQHCQDCEVAFPTPQSKSPVK